MTGLLTCKDGINAEKLAYVMELKNVKRGRISDYAKKYSSAKVYEGKSIWDVIKEEKVKVDIAFPSATQNEINGEHSKALVANGCYCVSEGANMPSTPDAVKYFCRTKFFSAREKRQTQAELLFQGLK